MFQLKKSKLCEKRLLMYPPYPSIYIGKHDVLDFHTKCSSMTQKHQISSLF